MTATTTADAGFGHFYSLIRQTPGVRLFTVLAYEPGGSLLRVYTNSPEFNPVGARKTTEVDPAWRDQCIEKKQVYFGETIQDIREVFTDWQAIRDFGCGTVLNIPVTEEGRLAGIINFLAAERQYNHQTVQALTALVAEHRTELVKLIGEAAQQIRKIEP